MTHVNQTKIAPEAKADVQDVSAAIGELQHQFYDFRQTNDLRLDQIEKRGSADVLTHEKAERISAAMDATNQRLEQFTRAQGRPSLALEAKSEGGFVSAEHKAAFSLYMRAGEASGLKTLESKAMSAGSGPDGGYLVPVPAEREILRRMANVSPIRSIATVQEISTATLKKAFSFSGHASGWVAEADPRPQSANQQIADMTFPAMELYAMPAATQTLLDDAVVDIEQWIADEVSTVFAEQEATAFVNGNGVGKPTGFMSYTKVAQSAWAWGKTGYVVTGAAGAFASANPSDSLVDLIYSIRAGYRQNARFVMNRRTQAQIRKIKATTGEYLWQPPSMAGQPATLMNFPLTEAEDMPDVAADNFAVAFGNFQRGYLIVDRMGIRVLRDPYTAKPYVLFYTNKRVGGGIQDFDAIKLLKFGTV